MQGAGGAASRTAAGQIADPDRIMGNRSLGKVPGPLRRWQQQVVPGSAPIHCADRGTQPDPVEVLRDIPGQGFSTRPLRSIPMSSTTWLASAAAFAFQVSMRSRSVPISASGSTVPARRWRDSSRSARRKLFILPGLCLVDCKRIGRRRFVVVR